MFLLCIRGVQSVVRRLTETIRVRARCVFMQVSGDMKQNVLQLSYTNTELENKDEIKKMLPKETKHFKATSLSVVVFYTVNK